MIYKNVYYHEGNIYYRNVGDRKYKKEKFVRKYFVEDPNGEYSLLKYGTKLSLKESTDSKTVRMLGESNKAYLYDLKPIEQYLLYTYKDEDRKISAADHRIAMFDIEIQSGRKFPMNQIIHIKGEQLTIEEFEKRSGYMDTKVYDEVERCVKSYRKSCFYKAEFPFANVAEYPINLINVWSSVDNKYHCWGLFLPYDKTREDGHDPLVTDYKNFEDESEMLKDFVDWFAKQDFDILSGWNSAKFDVPYVVNRLNKLLPGYAKKLSPLGLDPWIDNENTKSNANYDYSFNCDIPGLLLIDYMVMYRHLTRKFNLPSFKLDAICEAELGDKKIEYEGPIREFYRTNPNMFINYNHKDVELMVRLEKKLKLFNVAISLSHNGLVITNTISAMAKLAEGFILQFMLKDKKVPFNKEKDPVDWWIENGYYRNVLPDGKVEWQNLVPETRVTVEQLGKNDLKAEEKIRKDHLVFVPEYNAYYSYPPFCVKAGFCAAKPGLYSHCLDGDIESSYPHHIRQYNISPESVVKRPTEQEIKDRNLIKSRVNGVYFEREEGMIPKFVKNVFKERKHFKMLMMQAEHDHGKDSEEYMQYFVEQRTRKTIINSVYGAFLYSKFRFFDIDCARAITRGARTTIRELIEATDVFYKSDAIFKYANQYMPTIRVTFDDGHVDYFHEDDMIETDDGTIRAGDLCK